MRDDKKMDSTESSDFDARSAAFLASFKSQPGAVFHPDIAITDLRARGRGRGIIATADVPADTDLFIIPRDYVISVDNSALGRMRPDDGPLVSEDEDEDEDGNDDDNGASVTDLPKSWLDLILVMIYEYLHRGTSSNKWEAYWDVLPTQFDTLMFWSESDLAELKGSASQTKVGKEDADRMFRKKIVPAVRKWEGGATTNDLNDDDLLQLAHRMGSLIMAYAFDLESDNADADADEEENEDGWTEDRESKMAMGMVPMADMLNADAEFNAHLEHGENELTMRSLREIKQGEEVLNYYGPLPNSDLLRRYGYTSGKHARYDVVEISWDLVKTSLETALAGAKMQDIDDDDDEEIEESFVLERDSGDPDETGINRTQAKFTAFGDDLVEQVTAFASAALGIKNNKPNETQKRQLKKVFLQTMATALLARLTEYPTTVEQDEQLLLQEGPNAMEGRRRMAIEVRLGEKRLLREAGRLVAELLPKYVDVDDASGKAKNGRRVDEKQQRPSKKQKTR